MEDLTVFGFGAALAAYPRLSRLADKLVEDVMSARPKAVITVDVKGFSLRFAARLKRRMASAGWHAPIIHCGSDRMGLGRMAPPSGGQIGGRIAVSVSV